MSRPVDANVILELRERDRISALRDDPRKTEIREEIAPCPTCGTECYVKSEFTTQGRSGGAAAEYTPLPGMTYVD